MLSTTTHWSGRKRGHCFRMFACHVCMPCIMITHLSSLHKVVSDILLDVESSTPPGTGNCRAVQCMLSSLKHHFLKLKTNTVHRQLLHRSAAADCCALRLGRSCYAWPQAQTHVCHEHKDHAVPHNACMPWASTGAYVVLHRHACQPACCSIHCVMMQTIIPHAPCINAPTVPLACGCAANAHGPQHTDTYTEFGKP
jgi:hypothetical protein